MNPKRKKRTFIVQFNVNCYATTELRVSAATLKDAEQKALAMLNKTDFRLQLDPEPEGVIASKLHPENVDIELI